MGDVCGVFPQLGGMLRRRADKLSGGEREMLAIARVLMLDPRVVILEGRPQELLGRRDFEALFLGVTGPTT